MNLSSRTRYSVAALFRFSNNKATFQSVRTLFIPSNCILSSKSKFVNETSQCLRYFSVNGGSINNVLYNSAQGQNPDSLKPNLQTPGTGTKEEGHEIKRCRKTGRLIVYQGKLTIPMFAVKFVSLSTFALGFRAQPMLWSKFEESSLLVSLLLVVTVEFFTFVVPYIVHFLCKRYVVEILYVEKEDKYVAKTMNLLGILTELEFTTKEIRRLGPETTLVVDKGKERRPLFISPDNKYADPHHYERLVARNKTVDLRLSNNEVKSTVDNLEEIAQRRREEKNKRLMDKYIGQ